MNEEELERTNMMKTMIIFPYFIIINISYKTIIISTSKKNKNKN